ncbi:MAG: thiamine pyrophosphate-dependent enzyme [Anaerolineae bacterium]|nr:thiamine pyrophosphate-dependent enzyme [Anaerolineae bacterium]
MVLIAYFPSRWGWHPRFDTPAAIGAWLSKDSRKVVAAMGDFGSTFMVEELAVAAKCIIPLIVAILNNASLRPIRQNQR